MPTPPAQSPVDEVIAKMLARVEADPRFAPHQRAALRALAADARLTRADDIVRALKGESGEPDATP